MISKGENFQAEAGRIFIRIARAIRECQGPIFPSNSDFLYYKSIPVGGPYTPEHFQWLKKMEKGVPPWIEKNSS
jgi:hypothetical protein